MQRNILSQSSRYNGFIPGLIRNPQFLDLLVDSFFRTGVIINPEHKIKYIYLLAYAFSVCETLPKKGNKCTINNKDELKSTIQAIEKVTLISDQWN